MIKYNNITIFSAGVYTVKVKSIKDAIEFSTIIIGEKDIIYMDYEDKDIQLTYNTKQI